MADSPADLARYEQRAPGWDIRCLKCGFTEPAGKYMIRKWAAGRKYTFGRCRRCGRWGCHVVMRRRDARNEPFNPFPN